MNGVSGLALCAGMIALGAAAPSYAAPASKRPQQEILVPAGALSSGLEALALRYDVEILYDAAQLEGLEARAARGRMPVEAALDHILAGTPFSWERTGRNVIVVRQRCAADCLPEHFTFEPVVVSATRTPQYARHVASSVSVIQPSDLKDQAISDLRVALSQQSGLTVVNTGNVGGTTAVYVRGAYPHHTLFIIDGVRVNDRGATYNSFLGSASTGGFERFEILKGPQSPIYGSSAIGGVILTDTTYGAGAPHGELSLSAGAFNSESANALFAGEVRRFSYSALLQYAQTDNSLPDNGHEV